MLTPDQQEFYDRWLEKADNETQTEVGNLIDKYVTLFINYNFLYNMVPAVKAKQTNTPRKAVGDRAGATTCMIEFIGAPVISQYLSSEGLDSQVDRLFAAMPHFNIDLDKGTPQPLKDAQLIKDLKSTGASTRVLALLKTLYSIRCNIVHGEKGLHQYQQMLLNPAIQLLRSLVTLVYIKVNV